MILEAEIKDVIAGSDATTKEGRQPLQGGKGKK